MPGRIFLQVGRLKVARDEVSTGSGSDRIFMRTVELCRTDPVATASGTDLIQTVRPLLLLGAELISEVELQSAFLNFSANVFDAGLNRSTARLNVE